MPALQLFQVGTVVLYKGERVRVLKAYGSGAWSYDLVNEQHGELLHRIAQWMLEKELPQLAKYEVGDEVCIKGSTKWRVVGRYFRRSAQRFVYQLRFDRNGVESGLMPEEELHPL